VKVKAPFDARKLIAQLTGANDEPDEGFLEAPGK
jgi:hypothetical protein